MPTLRIGINDPSATLVTELGESDAGDHEYRWARIPRHALAPFPRADGGEAPLVRFHKGLSHITPKLIF
jgi:hypothetical protein